MKKHLQNCLKQLSELQEERIWLKGAFDLSHRQFNKSKSKALELQQELDQLILPQFTPVESPEAIAETEELIKQYSSYIKKLQNLQSALETLIGAEDVLKGMLEYSVSIFSKCKL